MEIVRNFNRTYFMPIFIFQILLTPITITSPHCIYIRELICAVQFLLLKNKVLRSSWSGAVVFIMFVLLCLVFLAYYSV